MEENKVEILTTELAEYVCDKLCQYPNVLKNEDELIDVCSECKMGKFICDIRNEYNELNDFEKSQCAILLRKMGEMQEKLKQYSDLEEQGLLHKAEIKDGTPIWYIASLDDGEPFLMKSSYIYNVTEYEVGSLEKDFWLSEEEAEAKLKELENENV